MELETEATQLERLGRGTRTHLLSASLSFRLIGIGVSSATALYRHRSSYKLSACQHSLEVKIQWDPMRAERKKDLCVILWDVRRLTGNTRQTSNLFWHVWRWKWNSSRWAGELASCWAIELPLHDKTHSWGLCFRMEINKTHFTSSVAAIKSSFRGSFRTHCFRYRWVSGSGSESESESRLLPKMMSFIAAKPGNFHCSFTPLFYIFYFLQQLITAFDMIFSSKFVGKTFPFCVNSIWFIIAAYLLSPPASVQ